MGLWSIFKGSRHRDAPVHWREDLAARGRASVYQICYSPETRKTLDPGFLVMDNCANGRPDWREYHPIRTRLLAGALDEERFYAFLSPKFGDKTGLSATQVHAFIDAHAEADVVLFSPFPELQAIFLNTFLQGEHFHPGLLVTADTFLGQIGVDLDLRAFVTDSSCSVFSNFFAAKPRFWREWLTVNERLFSLAEQRGTLGKLLRRPARYRDGEHVEFKIFLQERTADLLMGTGTGWRVAAYPPAQLSRIGGSPELMLRCNELKAAFRATGDASHLRAFHDLLARNDLPPRL
jgi:hypothetical protein